MSWLDGWADVKVVTNRHFHWAAYGAKDNDTKQTLDLHNP